MSATNECTHCKYPLAVKDEKTHAVFCPSCGLFVDPFFSWKKSDIHTIQLSTNTILWIPLVISATQKDAKPSSWVSASNQVADPGNKWGEAIHGFLARRACDADRARILHKKIYNSMIMEGNDDLIAMSVELRLDRDMNMLLDLFDVKITLPQAVQKYDGVIRRMDFDGKGAAAIHVFDPRNLSVKKHAANPPVSPKKAIDDQAFMNSLKTAW